MFALKRIVAVILLDVRETFGRRRVARFDANLPMVVVDERRGDGLRRRERELVRLSVRRASAVDGRRRRREGRREVFERFRGAVVDGQDVKIGRPAGINEALRVVILVENWERRVNFVVDAK